MADSEGAPGLAMPRALLQERRREGFIQSERARDAAEKVPTDSAGTPTGRVVSRRLHRAREGGALDVRPVGEVVVLVGDAELERLWGTWGQGQPGAGCRH